jgi:hypothetical protein
MVGVDIGKYNWLAKTFPSLSPVLVVFISEFIKFVKVDCNYCGFRGYTLHAGRIVYHNFLSECNFQGIAGIYRKGAA